MEQVGGGFEFTTDMVPLHPGLVGQVIAGRVALVAEFGLLVEVEVVGAVIDGLLRFDQTPYPEAARRYQVGDPIQVVVTAVDRERCKIGLALPAEPTADGWRWYPPEPGIAEPGTSLGADIPNDA